MNFVASLFLSLAAVAATENYNKTVLTISVLLPLSSQDLDGRPYLPALDVALELINNRQDLLQNYHLEAVVNDSACSAGASVRSFINQIFNPPVKIGIIGPICSTATQPVAELASYWNLVLISAGASNPRLSDTIEYPTLLRTVSSDAAVVDGIIAMMKHYGWSRIACVTQQEFIFTATYSELSEAIANNNLTESRNFQFSSNDNPQSEVDKLHNAPFRIIFLNMYPIKGIEVICQAQELGMTLENGYVWLTYAWYGNSWWTREPDTDTAYRPFNCSLKQREAFLKGTFSIDHFPFVEEEKNNVSTDIGLSLTEFYKMYHERLGNKYSHIPEQALSTIPFTPLFVDAIWTLAVALNNTEKDFPLVNFSYESFEMARKIFEHASNANFRGISGDVSYKSSGDRLGYVRYFQSREDSGETLSESVAYILEDLFHYAEGESDSTIFLNGEVPKDKLPDHIELWLLCSCAACSAVGIAYACVCLVFNLAFSKKRVIKLSSPYLNILIVIGAVLFYGDVILLGIDTGYVSETTANILCMIRVWIATIAFTLLFGPMFAKTWRVYYIFHASDQMKKTRKTLVNDGFLFLLIGCLLLVDVAFLLPLTILPSTRLHLETRELPSSDINLPVEVCICSASKQYIWIGILFAYKGLLLMVGVFLAFETRNVKISQLNDSHLIGMCVYTTVVLSIALSPVALLLDTNVDIFYGVIGVLILFGTTLILSLLFIPKFYSLIIDPSGDVVTTANGTHMNGGGLDEKKVEGLRQEIDKLRLEIANNTLPEMSNATFIAPKSYTVSEVVKARDRISSDAGTSSLVSPQHCIYPHTDTK